MTRLTSILVSYLVLVIRAEHFDELLCGHGSGQQEGGAAVLYNVPLGDDLVLLHSSGGHIS